MTTTVRAQTLLTAKDLTSPVLKRMSATVDRASAAMDRIRSSLGRVATAGGAAAAGLVLAGGAAALMAAGYASAAGDLLDLSRATGISTAALQGLQYVAGQQGGDWEAMQSGVVRLSKSMGDLHDPASELSKQLAKISPALATALKGAPTAEAALGLIAGGMGDLDEGSQLAVASLLLGRGAADDFVKSFGEGSEATKALLADFKALGGADSRAALERLGALDDALVKLGGQGNKAGLNFSAGLAPGLTAAANRLTAWLSQNQGRVEAWGKSAGAWLGSISWDGVAANVEKVAAGVQNVAVWAASAWRWFDRISGGHALEAIAGIGAITFAAPALAGFASLAAIAGAGPAVWTAMAIALGVSAMPAITPDKAAEIARVKKRASMGKNWAHEIELPAVKAALARNAAPAKQIENAKVAVIAGSFNFGGDSARFDSNGNLRNPSSDAMTHPALQPVAGEGAMNAAANLMRAAADSFKSAVSGALLSLNINVNADGTISAGVVKPAMVGSVGFTGVGHHAATGQGF